LGRRGVTTKEEHPQEEPMVEEKQGDEREENLVVLKVQDGE
jgi:hypothetical protein